MNIPFAGYAYKYQYAGGKWVFAPSDRGRKIGIELKREVERRFDYEPFYYHLQRGGHVAALHVHREKKYFARLDLENFFYNISRNRVARELRGLQVARAGYLAKWSTVKNPYAPPSYSLPYGFVQSPILATLVLAKSSVGDYLRELANMVVVSVYMDDIAISGNNRRVLERAYRRLVRLVGQSNFVINDAKSAAPGLTLVLFNCHVQRLRTVVTTARQAEFYAIPRAPDSAAAFEEYCAAVARGNAP